MNDTINLENFHSLEIEETIKLLDTSTQGLSLQEAEKRVLLYGKNLLPEAKQRTAFVRFLYQFHNVLIYVLILAGVATAFLGHWVDSSVIFAVVMVNSIIGFLQEGKAENALKAIQQMLSVNAMVVRDGKQTSIKAELLVPGDVVFLQSGDKVPADLRLFHVKGFQVQESALTGESLAVDKTIEAVSSESVIGDRKCIAYSSTLVTHGQASGVVFKTGANTEIGRISTLVSQVQTLTTPLLVQMAQFGRWLTGAILILAVITFIFGFVVRSYSYTDMFLAAVSLAVAAIPEGLPAIMTITLAIGVQRMAKRNSIIRKLPAVETLGAVSVICSDKTGTLTRNEMTVCSLVTAEDIFELSGTGYNPHGSISLSGRDILSEDYLLLEELSQAAILCNDTSLEQKENEWLVHGDPMEGALLVAGLKAGLDIETEIKKYPRTDLIPFEAEHRFMATLHHSHKGEAFIVVKGAPEQILEMCTKQRSSQVEMPLDKSYWLDRIEELAGQGQRVLAMALKPVNTDKTELSFSDVESELVLLGMFGMIDPPREEAIEAVELCKRAGIRVKMITGDHGATALAISRQINLINTKEVLTGKDIDAMSEDDLRARVIDVDVYARVNPEHKLLLVKLLQEQDLIVAMTGDGVNDAPALKRADVGTAMGYNGTEVAKEAAEMVLVDDNFASIMHAVKEGRTVYDNLKKSIIFILPTNGGEALIVLGAIILGFEELPLTPVQILWVNMITAVTLALSLAFEPPEKNVMNRPPRKAREAMLTSSLIWRVIAVSFIIMSGTMGLFLWELEQGHSIEYARTVAVNTLVMFEIFYLFNARYIKESVLNWQGLTGNPLVLMAIGILILFQLGFTYLSPMQSLFKTTSIDALSWLSIVAISFSVLLLVELEKYFVRQMDKGKLSNS